MDKYIGKMLDNRYEILEVIGTGGMAVVYKARCHRLNRLVAIKILKDDYMEDEDFRRRFHAESQAVAMLSHPNIVSVYDVSTSIMADYIVMELVDGISLKQYMEKKGVLNWKETLHFGMQIAKALEHAHSRGIIHRDIKPHNVMVLKNGSIKVTDFGIARIMSKGNTLTKEALGSVHYISPEQSKGGHVDNRSDIYSLGVVMYEMIAGRPPYDGESPVAVAIQHINGGAAMPSTLNPNIPGGLEQIIMKAMACDPGERYASATQMLMDMDEFRKNPAILFDYQNLSDVAREQTAAAIAEQLEAREAAGQMRPQIVRRQNPEIPQRSRQQTKPKKMSKGTLISIIAGAVAILAGIVVLVIVLVGSGNKNKLITVPNLVGLTYADLGEYPGFNVRILEEVPDDSAPAGQITLQEPEANDQVRSGSTILVTVSKGPAESKIEMQDYRGKMGTQVQSLLSELKMNLVVQVQEEYSATVEEGKVINTTPQAGETLTTGQTITLYVSKGPEAVTKTMPTLVGWDIEKAKNILSNNGFPEPTIEYEESNKTEGQVIAQSVEKGETVDVNSVEIILTVSSGTATDKNAVTKVVTFEIPEEYVLIGCNMTVKLDGKVVLGPVKVKAGTESYTAEMTYSGTKIFKVYFGDDMENAEYKEVVFTTDD